MSVESLGWRAAQVAAAEWRSFATVAIFVLALAGVAFGRAPGLRIDRAGMALVGASLMLAVGAISFEDALKAIDLDTLALLLGMMIIIAHFRIFRDRRPVRLKAGAWPADAASGHRRHHRVAFRVPLVVVAPRSRPLSIGGGDGLQRG
jgi:hypothetical protein